MTTLTTSRSKFQELPIMTVLLVGINVAVFIVCQFTDALYRLGQESVLDVFVNREYGRIIWAMFLHADRYHLFNNMLILFFLGEMLEKEIGHLPFTVLYFLSGIGSGLLSLFMRYLSGDPVASIGASGAVFGLDGVLLALVLFSRKNLSYISPARVLLMIALSLYNGFMSSNVDNMGHVGGLLTGFMAAGILCIMQNRKNKKS